MSKPFLYIVIALLVAYGAFMTWLHYAEIRDFDRCHAPSAAAYRYV